MLDLVRRLLEVTDLANHVGDLRGEGDGGDAVEHSMEIIIIWNLSFSVNLLCIMEFPANENAASCI